MTLRLNPTIMLTFNPKTAKWSTNENKVAVMVPQKEQLGKYQAEIEQMEKRQVGINQVINQSKDNFRALQDEYCERHGQSS